MHVPYTKEPATQHVHFEAPRSLRQLADAHPTAEIPPGVAPHASWSGGVGSRVRNFEQYMDNICMELVYRHPIGTSERHTDTPRGSYIFLEKPT